MSRRIRLAVILGVTLACAVGVLAIPPLPQSQDYHNFADRRPLLGIPNFLDVASNAAFLLAGGLGLLFLARQRGSNTGDTFTENAEQRPYAILFLGIALTGIGSAYYHLAHPSRFECEFRFFARCHCCILAGLVR